MRISLARSVASPLSSPLVAHGNVAGGAPLGCCARRLQAVSCLVPPRSSALRAHVPFTTSSSSFLLTAAPHATRPVGLVLPRAPLGAGSRTLRLRGGLGPSSARRSYASTSGAAGRVTGEEETTTRKPSGGKGQREAEKVITDITPHLAELDAEKRQKGGVDPKHVAAVLRMVWEGREHISEKGREGERLLRHLKWLRAGGEGGVEGYTDLISALAKFGLVDDCFAVFNRMKDSGVQPNEWTYTALISACVPRRDWTRAMRVFEEMREQREDLKPDAVTYTLLLKANEGRTVVEVKEAMQLLTKLKKSGVVPNVRLFDALINVISGNNFLEGKVGLNQERKEMEEGRSKYIKHKRRDSMHDQARAQKEMREMGKARRLELVLDVLERMKEFEKLTREVSGAEPLRANIYLFNSLLRAYKLNGENQSDFEEAFVVFEELMKPRPNVETYTTLLEIACKMRYRDHGERLIRKMKKAKSVINSKATESERAELERLKARVKKLPLSPEAVLQLQLAPEELVEADLDGEDATIIDSTTA